MIRSSVTLTPSEKVGAKGLLPSMLSEAIAPSRDYCELLLQDKDVHRAWIKPNSHIVMAP